MGACWSSEKSEMISPAYYTMIAEETESRRELLAPAAKIRASTRRGREIPNRVASAGSDNAKQDKPVCTPSPVCLKRVRPLETGRGKCEKTGGSPERRAKFFITGVTEDGNAFVMRVRIVGESGMWRLVQPWRCSAAEDRFEFVIHSRFVYDSWIAAWRRAKASARRVGKRDFRRVPETGVSSYRMQQGGHNTAHIASLRATRCMNRSVSQSCTLKEYKSGDATRGGAEAPNAADCRERPARI